jgi:hypothetical protein
VADARFLDLHGEVDKLYQAPLAEFTAARNALAARIKAAHGADAAAQGGHQIQDRHNPEAVAPAITLAGESRQHRPQNCSP